MQWLSGFQHYEVCGIHEIVDGLDAADFKAVFKPLRTFSRFYAFYYSRDVAAAVSMRVIPYRKRAFNRFGFGFCKFKIGNFKFDVSKRGYFSRQANMPGRIGNAVGQYFYIQRPIAVNLDR